MDPLAEGTALFNAGKFWHAHEAWEQLWLPARGAEREFLQGLIQLAAAYHHAGRGNARGAMRLFDAALRRLEPFAAGHDRIDRAAAVAAARRHRERVARGERVDPEEFPKLFAAP